MIRLSFLGAAGTVTGSKYLVESTSKRILVDCGLFQGLKDLRLRNWEEFPVDPATIDAVVLTHAHLDHSGYLPKLAREGFRGPVFCTPATEALTRILLPDAAHLQEEDARYANRKGFSRHKPALPLYTLEDAERAMSLLTPVSWDQAIELDDVRVRFQPAGHILGASWVRITQDGTEVVFSGDLGRPNDLLLRPPQPIEHAQNLVLDSTYGNRRHPQSSPMDALGAIIRRTAERGGVVLIPAFAVGRSQQILLLLSRLKAAGSIPDVPVYLNSPMAIAVTDVLRNHCGDHVLSPDECAELHQVATYVHTAEDSKALNARTDPMILIAGSGMATGGRILHHLKAFGPDARNSIVLAGFQAAGTRGEALLAGVPSLKIHGEYVPINAERVHIDELSGHADYKETTDWLRTLKEAPRRLFLTHGEPAATDALRRYVRDELGFEAHIPRHGEVVELP